MGSVLRHLVLADKVVQVGLCLCELHLVHPLRRVVVDEGLPLEEGGEPVADMLAIFYKCEYEQTRPRLTLIPIKL